MERIAMKYLREFIGVGSYMYSEYQHKSETVYKNPCLSGNELVFAVSEVA